MLRQEVVCRTHHKETGQSIIVPLTGISINMFNKSHLSPPQYQHSHYSRINDVCRWKTSTAPLKLPMTNKLREAKQQMRSRSPLFTGFPFLLSCCGWVVIVTMQVGSLGCRFQPLITNFYLISTWGRLTILTSVWLCWLARNTCDILQILMSCRLVMD